MENQIINKALSESLSGSSQYVITQEHSFPDLTQGVCSIFNGVQALLYLSSEHSPPLNSYVLTCSCVFSSAAELLRVGLPLCGSLLSPSAVTMPGSWWEPGRCVLNDVLQTLPYTFTEVEALRNEVIFLKSHNNLRQNLQLRALASIILWLISQSLRPRKVTCVSRPQSATCRDQWSKELRSACAALPTLSYLHVTSCPSSYPVLIWKGRQCWLALWDQINL